MGLRDCGIAGLRDCGIARLRDCGSVGLRDGGSVDGGSVEAWDYGIVGSILEYSDYERRFYEGFTF